MKKAIENFRQEMKKNCINPENGLGTELFLMVSSMTPILNVDLFITDAQGRVLLSWRDDQHCGKGWHIPGGCVRFKEILDTRIHMTAITELGADVHYNPRPLLVRENIAMDDLTVQVNRNERAHFISLLYDCKLVNQSKLADCDGQEISGHLKWFDKVPENFIQIQHYYRPFLSEWFTLSNN